MFQIGDIVRVVNPSHPNGDDLVCIGTISHTIVGAWDYEVDFGFEIPHFTHTGRGHHQRHYRYYKRYQLESYTDDIEDIEPSDIMALL